MAFNWSIDNKDRVSLRPIIHDDIWQFRKKIEGCHWTAQEIDLTKDINDWNAMSNDEKHFIKMQLAFFARIDIDVLDNLDDNFGKEIDCMEAQMVYHAQKDQECVHAESYALQIEAIMFDKEREEVMNATLITPCITGMRNWVMQWFNKDLHIGTRLVAFTVVEGVMFSASFSALQWLRTKNKLNGITQANSFIARDEGLHTMFSCLLIRRYLVTKPSFDIVKRIFDDAIKSIDTFIEISLPNSVDIIDSISMKQYVRYQADSVINHMGYPTIYNVENPYSFMDALTLNEVSKANFFETRSTSYQNVITEGCASLSIDDSIVN